MTASDLTQTRHPDPFAARDVPSGQTPNTPPQGFAALLELGGTLTDSAMHGQRQVLRYLRRKQDRDAEFIGALMSAQNPVTAAGTVMGWWQSSLTDWMTEATRSLLALPTPAQGEATAAPPAPERIGVLAGPVAPIPGAPDSAPKPQSGAQPPAPASPTTATGGKSRATPV